MSNAERLPLPHSNNDMPPLPPSGAFGPQVCATIRLYLAVINDLPSETVAALQDHLHICAGCAQVQRLLQHTTGMFSNLASSTPSSRIDQAIMAAIATRGNRPASTQHARNHFGSAQFTTSMRSSRVNTPVSAIPTSIAAHTSQQHQHFKSFAAKPLAITVSVLALVAMLFLVLSTTLHFLGIFQPSSEWTFSLPQNLSWNNDVLYHSETRINNGGKLYYVNTYNDLGNGNLHVETLMTGVLDVVAIGTVSKMLGLDMMHHVAQWDANDWSDDESIFNLAALRNDLAQKRAVYLDEDMFHGEKVYRIRCYNGLVLLLNMNYQPVNVLRGAIGPGTGEPIYDTLKIMPASTVSSSMWNMSVPSGFKMGTLPQRP